MCEISVRSSRRLSLSALTILALCFLWAMPTSPRAGGGAQVASIPKLGKEDLHAKAIQDGAWLQAARADANIKACGGARDPVFRENAQTMIAVRFAKTPSVLDHYIQAYDQEYERVLEQRKAAGCNARAVEEVYTGYIRNQNWVVERSSTFQAADAKSTHSPGASSTKQTADAQSTKKSPKPARGRSGGVMKIDCENPKNYSEEKWCIVHGKAKTKGTKEKAAASSQMITDSAGQVIDCLHTVDRNQSKECTRQGKSPRISPLGGVVKNAARYQAWADACGDPSGVEVRQDATSRISSLPPATREALVQKYEASYEFGKTDAEQQMRAWPAACATKLPQMRGIYDVVVANAAK